MVIAAASNKLAWGECVISEPIPSALAENTQIYAQLCNLGWSNGHSILPCPTADPAPIVESGSTRSHGATVNMTTPSFYSGGYAAIWWQVVDSGYNVLYTDRTVQGKPTSGYPVGTVVRYGVTGLYPGLTYYVRSAAEYANNKKTCWSSWATIQTTSYAPSGPAIPSGLYVKYEDDFDRPGTDPQHASSGSAIGNGIGPDQIYWTSDIVNTEHAVRIDGGGQEARVKPSGAFYYAPKIDAHHNTFAQLKTRVDMAAGGTGFAYNLQTQVRIGLPDPQTGIQKSYAVKLVKGARGCSSAALLLYRLPDEYNDAKCEVIGGQEVIDPDIGGAYCTSAPPLDVEDSSRTGYSKPVWIRGEVFNDPDGYPVIRGQAYWYDSSGNLQSCTATAPTRTDAGDPGGMANVRGRWGASFHEKHYVIDEIVGGDGLAP
jgi:hypothetical protein